MAELAYPAEHFVQSLAPDKEYVPCPQVTQALAELLPELEFIVPAGHCVHVAAPERE